MNKRASHEERVALILERLNVMLELAGLPPAAPCGDDRNIFKSTTEIALATEAGILLLGVADLVVEGERNLLDAELGRFVAVQADELRRPVPCEDETEQNRVVAAKLPAQGADR